MRPSKPVPEIAMVVLTDEPSVRDHANTLVTAGIPVAIVSARYSDVVPFMFGNNGHTVVLVADVDDPEQLAGAIATIERRLGTVGSVIRYATDLPSAPVHHAA